MQVNLGLGRLSVETTLGLWMPMTVLFGRVREAALNPRLEKALLRHLA